MATFNFKTGNAHIDGKIDYSYTRTQTGFTVKYAVYMRRNNTYTESPTTGNISYIFYISNSYTDSGQIEDFTVPNNKTWAKIVSGTKTYETNVFNTNSFRVGFESNGERSAYNVEKQMSDSVPVPAYATRPSLSKLSIVYNAGDNYYTFKGTIGNNGTNNIVTGCKVFYTTDGQTPTASSPNFVVSGKEKTSWVKKIDILALEGNQTIKARVSTLAPLGSTDTPEDDTISQTVAYYSPPYPLEDLQIEYTTSKPTPNSGYTFKWKLREAGSVGYNNPIGSYYVNIFIDDILKETKIINDPNSFFIEYTGKELGLEKGNFLKFSAQAQGTSNYNNISALRTSENLEIVSAGIAKIRTSNNWKEGQVWIKTTEGNWVRSTGVYVKTSNGWKQSI